ncbi:hypothetical protein GW17_00054390 [Ensete ventricosum]|nr:hypothetical protein GW17_00054390 [Ensete ventricosum]
MCVCVYSIPRSFSLYVLLLFFPSVSLPPSLCLLSSFKRPPHTSSNYDSLCLEEGEERRNPIPQLCRRGWRSKLRRKDNSRRYPFPGVVSFCRLSKSPCVESHKYEFPLLSSVGWRSIVLGLEWGLEWER